MAYIPQYGPGTSHVAENRRRQMNPTYNLEKVRDITDEDIVMVLGHRAPGSAYPTAHPPLAEQQEPDCPMRKLVKPTDGAKAGDRVRYVQFADSMFNAPSQPYQRTYAEMYRFRAIDPGTLSGRQVVEARERDMEEIAKFQLETEMTCPALGGLRGATVHGHSLRLPEDGLMFDMLDRCRVEDGNVIMHKDQVGRPIDKKVILGKPMSAEEAAKRTTIYRVDNVAFRDDPEVIEWVHRVFDNRTCYGFKPEN